jgi:hypothetical protein
VPSSSPAPYPARLTQRTLRKNNQRLIPQKCRPIFRRRRLQLRHWRKQLRHRPRCKQLPANTPAREVGKALGFDQESLAACSPDTPIPYEHDGPDSASCGERAPASRLFCGFWAGVGTGVEPPRASGAFIGTVASQSDKFDRNCIVVVWLRQYPNN